MKGLRVILRFDGSLVLEAPDKTGFLIVLLFQVWLAGIHKNGVSVRGITKVQLPMSHHTYDVWYRDTSVLWRPSVPLLNEQKWVLGTVQRLPEFHEVAALLREKRAGL